jgi:hypothetical protein
LPSDYSEKFLDFYRVMIKLILVKSICSNTPLYPFISTVYLFRCCLEYASEGHCFLQIIGYDQGSTAHFWAWSFLAESLVWFTGFSYNGSLRVLQMDAEDSAGWLIVYIELALNNISQCLEHQVLIIFFFCNFWRYFIYFCFCYSFRASSTCLMTSFFVGSFTGLLMWSTGIIASISWMGVPMT